MVKYRTAGCPCGKVERHQDVVDCTSMSMFSCHQTGLAGIGPCIVLESRIKHVHAHTHMHTQTDRQTHTHTHTHMHTDAHTHTCTHMDTHRHTHTQTYTHTDTHTSDLRHVHRGSDDSEQLC